MKDKFYFFYGGFLSQWHGSEFVIDGVKYNCAEQYMMSEKAKLFGDDFKYDLIMQTSNPYRQKKLGRLVNNFNLRKWNEVCKDVVVKGNYAKFSQNENLKKLLLETGDKELVEASSTDTIWGIGMGEYDTPFIYDKSKWQGTNWLGECLMRVRDMLREELV